MRIRECLVFEGGGAGIDTDKAHRWTIDRLWWEAGDPVASRSSLAACRQRGIGVGLKLNGDGEAPAEAMHEALTERGFTTTTAPRSCGAMFDPEPFNAAAILMLLRRWRQLRTARYTVLAIAPWQGGLFTPELVQQVNGDANLLVAPFAYVDVAGDSLYPAWAPAALDELERLGIRRERLTSFIDAKRQPIAYGWEGILYGFDKLPASPPAPL
jgi:hypothetical protein